MNWVEADSSGKVQSASEPCLLLRYCPSGFSQWNVSCIHCSPSSWQDLFFFILFCIMKQWEIPFWFSEVSDMACKTLSLLFVLPVPCVLAELLQSCLTFCSPMDHSLPGSSVHGILQARIPEWVAMSSSRGIFRTQGLNPCLLHWQPGSLSLVPPGKPPVPSVYEKILVF